MTEQGKNLERTLSQVESYQGDIQNLRQKMVQEEQQLRGLVHGNTEHPDNYEEVCNFLLSHTTFHSRNSVFFLFIFFSICSLILITFNTTLDKKFEKIYERNVMPRIQ